MKFELDDLNRGHSDEQLLDDLRRVARDSGAATLSIREYETRGKYHPTTLIRRFGGWNRALKSAGIELGWRVNIPDEELFSNIATVWRHLGRQPRYDDMGRSPSTFSPGGYAKRFGGWRKALAAFVVAMNDSETAPAAVEQSRPRVASPTSPRAPSWRLRFLVMRRDRFRCCACGRSPATDPGTRLAVDHVHARSRGGATEMENLQTLCEPCNGGKSDLEWTVPPVPAPES